MAALPPEACARGWSGLGSQGPALCPTKCVGTLRGNLRSNRVAMNQTSAIEILSIAYKLAFMLSYTHSSDCMLGYLAMHGHHGFPTSCFVHSILHC